jgi:teichuronic acid biosynthesis glycosyltransferase TuaG
MSETDSKALKSIGPGQEFPIAPRVSIIMPAYNAERYIAEAINSVIAQTVVDWELLIIDDCSADKTRDIAAAFEKEDERIRCIASNSNIGAAGARNKGLDEAKGEWIAFLDSDDIWRREKLEKQLAYAGAADADIVYSSYRLFGDSAGKGRDYIVPASTNYEYMLKENTIGCSTVLIRRSALKGRRFSEKTFHEDYALWLELLRNGCKAAGCIEVLTDWRMVEGARSFDKIAAARNRWHIYREIEKLSFAKSAVAFAAYAVSGVLKHRRI